MKKLSVLLLLLLSISYQVSAHELNYLCDGGHKFKDIYIELDSKKNKAKIVINNKNYIGNYEYNIPKISFSKIILNNQLLKWTDICECKYDFSFNLEIDKYSSLGNIKLKALNSDIKFNKNNLKKNNLENCVLQNEIIKERHSPEFQEVLKQFNLYDGTPPKYFDCNSEDILMPKEYKSESFFKDTNFCKRYCFQNKNDRIKIQCKKF